MSAPCFSASSNFNPRPPRGERPEQKQSTALREVFQSTPSARRATSVPASTQYMVLISIHALREESDPGTGQGWTILLISIHALREESDPFAGKTPRMPSYFNPRPPRGERPWALPRAPPGVPISIHALREESDSKSSEKIHHVCSIIHTCAQFEKELYKGSGKMQNKSC